MSDLGFRSILYVHNPSHISRKVLRMVTALIGVCDTHYFLERVVCKQEGTCIWIHVGRDKRFWRGTSYHAAMASQYLRVPDYTLSLGNPRFYSYSSSFFASNWGFQSHLLQVASDRSVSVFRGTVLPWIPTRRYRRGDRLLFAYHLPSNDCTRARGHLGRWHHWPSLIVEFSI